MDVSGSVVCVLSDGVDECCVNDCVSKQNMNYFQQCVTVAILLAFK